MSKAILIDLDFVGSSRQLNLPDPLTAQEPSTKNYVDTKIGTANSTSLKQVTETVVSLGTANTFTLDPTQGTVFTGTTTTNCTINFANNFVTAGKSSTMSFWLTGGGIGTITYTGNTAAIKWPSATVPTFSSNTDLVTFTTDGTNIYGFQAGKNFG